MQVKVVKVIQSLQVIQSIQVIQIIQAIQKVQVRLTYLGFNVLCFFFVLFLAVQDSSIGDLVTHSVSQ